MCLSVSMCVCVCAYSLGFKICTIDIFALGVSCKITLSRRDQMRCILYGESCFGLCVFRDVCVCGFMYVCVCVRLNIASNSMRNAAACILIVFLVTAFCELV